MLRKFFALLMIFLPLTAFAAGPAYITSMRIQPSAQSSRITFFLNKKTSGRVKYLPSPGRVIVEFSNTRKNFHIKNLRLMDTNILFVRTEETAGNLRFIFFVKDAVKWNKVFLPNNTNSFILQLDIISIQPTFIRPPKIPVDKIQTSLQKDLQAELAKVQSKPLQSIFNIVIDAGHGGRDTGAMGKNGMAEKSIVLAIAKKLAVEINQQKNMHAVLTRSGDYFVPLRGRLKLARKGKADLFIAIHADAYFDGSAKGASVYALSPRGATSEAARWLAQRDNFSELGDVELNSLQDHSPMVRSVLIDLAQTATIQDSLRVGNKILDALENVSSLHYTHVAQAPFVVLKSPDIPSILVETGFISNPYEAKRLSDPDYQAKVAHALREGIERYVSK